MLLFREAGAHIAILFVLGILGNMISGIFTPAAGALLPHIVEEDKLQQANAFFSIKNSLEGILGIVLAGVLYAALPIHTLFFLVGACFIASGISEMLIRVEHVPSADKLTLRLAFADMGEGLRYLRAQKAAVALLGAMLFINFFFAPVTGNFIPYFVRTDLAAAPSYLLDRVLTPELWSSVFSVCFGAGSLVGAAVLSARKPAEKCGHRIAILLCIISAIMIALTIGYHILVDRGGGLDIFLPVFSIACIIQGVLIAHINIPATTVMMRIVDKDKLSKVNSIVNIGSQGMIPIASVLAGAVLQSFGSTALLAACTLGFTVTAVLLLVNRPVREF